MKRHLLICLILCALTLIVYAQTFEFNFVSIDDLGWIADNPFVITGLSHRNVSWAFSLKTMETHANYVPLTFLSLMVDAQIYGSEAGGFHLSNVLLHCANSILLYFMLYQMTHNAGKCTIIAALFAIHPLHVESVAWVTCRKDVLSTFFGLLAIWCYACYTDRYRMKYYFTSTVLFLLSLLAKQTLVTLPFLLLLLDFWPLRRWPCNYHDACTKNQGRHNSPQRKSSGGRQSHWQRLLIEKVPFLLLSLVFCSLALVAQTKGMAVSQRFSLPSRLGNTSLAYIEYMVKAFWPSKMSVFYPQGESAVSVMAVGGGLLLIMSAIAVVLAKRAPYLFTGWFWFLGTFVPMAGIVQLGAQRIADRYTYVPLTGLFLLTIWHGDVLLRRHCGSKYWLPAIISVTIMALTRTAWLQTTYWRDSVVLYEHGISVTENNARLHALLGLDLFERGKVEESFTHFQQATGIEPQGYFYYGEWGACLLEAGRISEAKQMILRSLAINPNHVPAHFTLGVLHEREGRLHLAGQHYATALAAYPNHTEAHYNLGLLLMRADRLDDAIDHFQQAVTINPAYAWAHNNLGVAFLAQRKFDLAILHFEEALRIDPALKQAQRGLQAVRAERLTKVTH